MDSKFSKKKILSFVKQNKINMSESKKSINQFKTFNDFFSRELKSGSRKINKNQNAIISPTDGKIVVFENLNHTTKFYVKGEKFNIKEFLQDKKILEKYNSASMAIIRLAPVDYHRFHFPVSGMVTPSVKINGSLDSVSPIALLTKLKIFWQNKREYTIINSKQYGNILMAEIGATMVGSIIQTFKCNSQVQKGQEKGYFKMGGSSVLLLFEKDKVVFDKDLIKNTKNKLETQLQMGEMIGRAI